VFCGAPVYQTANRTTDLVINTGLAAGADGDEFLRLSTGRQHE